MSGGSRRTMAFTNDTEYPVLIKGINERTRVTFELYGINDGRTVELQDPRVENVVKGGAWFEFSDKLAPGVKRKEQDAYDSFDSWVTRIVRDAQGNVLHEDTFFSHYKKLDAITLVGRYPGDPPDGTLIRPEDYHPGGTPPPPPPPPPTDGGPVANFTKAAVDGDTYSFTDTSSGSITSRSWDFGDGGTSSNRNPTHDYAAEGTYTVTLTVTDSAGLTSSRSRNVTVSGGPPPTPDKPSARFTVSGSGDTYTFTATGANVDTWTWSYSDGGSDSGNPSATHTFEQHEAETQYTVTLTVTGPGGHATKSRTVTVPGTGPPPP
jgi:PKD repeat protein